MVWMDTSMLRSSFLAGRVLSTPFGLRLVFQRAYVGPAVDSFENPGATDQAMLAGVFQKLYSLR